MNIYEPFFTRCENLFPSFNWKRIRECFNLLAQCDCLRNSEEKLGVIELLLAFRPDESSVMVVLLHDCVEKESSIAHYSTTEILKLISLFNRVRFFPMPEDEERSIANFHKFFLVTAQDVRVAMIVLAFHLFTLKKAATANFSEQKYLAWQALKIYSPIAARLSMYKIKNQIEDLSFRYLYPAKFQDIVSEVQKKQRDRSTDITRMQQIIEEILKKEHINAKVYGRVKHYYGIYFKLKRKGKSILDDILDFFALRIVLPDIYRDGMPFYGHCYHVLGILYNYFNPLPHRFKDYISMPKSNGYRSLHTTVTGFDLETSKQPPVEIQIRTESMDEEANYGYAAHWFYSSAKIYGSFLEESGQQFFKQRDRNSFDLKLSFDHIFVFTPQGKVVDLPAGSTPIDMAYAIDIHLGHSCGLVKVNNKIVPLDRILTNGDIVNITAKPQAIPNRYWLFFVKSDHAKRGIALFFEQEDRVRHIRIGKSLVESFFKKYRRFSAEGNDTISSQMADKKLLFLKNEQILEKIGKGELLVRDAMEDFLYTFNHARKMNRTLGRKKAENLSAKNKNFFFKAINVAGLSEMPYKLSACCNPQEGDEICGYITRGKGIAVHKKDCQMLSSLESERLMEVSWEIKFIR